MPRGGPIHALGTVKMKMLREELSMGGGDITRKPGGLE